MATVPVQYPTGEKGIQVTVYSKLKSGRTLGGTDTIRVIQAEKAESKQGEIATK